MRRLFSLILAGVALAAGAGRVPPALKAEARSAPLFFTPNSGQAPRGVRFMARTPRLTAYFSRGEAQFCAAAGAVRMRFEDARAAEPEARGRLPGVANYLNGAGLSLPVSRGPEGWGPSGHGELRPAALTGRLKPAPPGPGARSLGLPLYREIVYRDLYPGIDMVYGVAGRGLKSEFRVAAGAHPAAIRVRYSGTGKLSIAEDGSLAIPLGAAPLREEAPTIYQEIEGKRILVPGRFALSGDAVTFEIGRYDASRPLIIDPAIAYSTLLGGSGADAANAIAVDASGAVYIAGFTESTNLPTVNPARTFNAGGDDVFIAKFNANGSGLVYCTYLGGSGQDIAAAIAVDASGAVYVAGSTTSADFPTRAPLQSRLAGARNAFAVKLAPAGNSLVYSTYLGGSGSDSANGIAVDAAGNAYLTGDTTSFNFPAPGWQRNNRGGQDAFAAKISADGSRLLWSSYLGGSGADRGAAIAVNAAGEAWIAGSTWSADFPTAGAFQNASGGGQDAFVARFSADGNTLAFASYLGGSGGTAIYPEAAQAIALDAAGNAYVAGVTSSADFPALKPVQSALKGAMDAFATKVSAAGALVYSTYLGGSGVDIANAVAVDWSGSAYIAGYTYSTDLLAVNALQSTNAGDCDAFLAKLNSTPAVAYLSYLGGRGADTATALAVDAMGGVYLAGWTLSTNLPLLNPYQATDGNAYGAFVTKLNFTAPATAVRLGTADSVSAYLGGTSSIDFSGVRDGALASSITDGALTVTFDSPMEKQMAGPTLSTYWTWNLWPYSQLQTSGSRMPALASGIVWPGPFTHSITMHLSQPVRTFGFEATPANSSDALLTATFYASEADPSGSVVAVDHVGWLNGASCTAMDCSGGSQFIAASGGPIQKVTVTITPHDIVSASYPGDSFAIAGFRYSASDQGASAGIAAPVAQPAPHLAPQPTPATLVGPASGSALPGAAATFEWSAGVGVTQYWAYLSRQSVGGKDLYSASQGLKTSLAANNLPTNGGTVYLRLWSQLAGGWQYIDYSFAAANSAASPAAAPVTSAAAVIISPDAQSTLAGPTSTFAWNAGTGVSQYWLYLGTTGPGSKDIYSQSEGLRRYQTVSNLPGNGGAIYARLWSKIGANWQYADSVYRTAPAR
jgi:hypothetical protein